MTKTREEVADLMEAREHAVQSMAYWWKFDRGLDREHARAVLREYWSEMATLLDTLVKIDDELEV